LSQIERNCANPSLTVLYRVAMALSVPVAQLLGEQGSEATLEVVEAGDPHRKMFTNQTCTGRLLNPAWLDKEWEFYELNFPKGGKLESQPHHPQTREMLTVVEGRVRVTTGGKDAPKSAELKPGDTAFYSADVEHRIENIGKEAAVVYLGVRYRDAR
jgi:mannose-6-phosphate isomerase-like protein (cupin superfamily)